MLDAAELIELAVFERHCLNLESKSERHSLRMGRPFQNNENAVVINYFKDRINDLKERSKDN